MPVTESIPSKESSKIEFKECLTDGLEKTITAFLNKDGGLLYIGVTDDGEIIGVENTDLLQRQILDRLKYNISPSIMGLFDISLHKYNTKQIIKVTVCSGPAKPYYITSKGMSPKGCYIRVGSSSQPMTIAQIDDAYAKRSHNTLGSIPSPNQDLEFSDLMIYYSQKKFTITNSFLKNLGLLNTDNKYNYAGFLLSDVNSLSLKIAQFSGIDKTDLIQNEEFGYCCLVTAVKKVLDKLDVMNTTRAKVTNTVRVEKRLVDSAALREAVINAVVHNDYSRAVPPVVLIFADRIEITSYGGLVPGLTEEEFYAGQSMPRNQELMRVFRDLNLVEQLGSGLPKILSTYGRSAFLISENFIRVTFMFDGDIAGGNMKSDLPLLTQKLDDIDKAIVKMIAEDQKITGAKIAVKIGISERQVQRTMAELKSQGIIQRVGSARHGYWAVKTDTQDE